MAIDLTITARQNGTEPEDGMRLAELERTCAALRRNGGADDTQIDVRTNRAHRVRQVTAIALDDEPRTAPLGGPQAEQTNL